MRNGSVIACVAFWTKRGLRCEHIVVTTWMTTMPVKPDSQTTRARVRCGLCVSPKTITASPLRKPCRTTSATWPMKNRMNAHKSQEMQTPRALPSVKDFDVPRETRGDGGGHRYSRRDAERREQEYDGRVAQLLQCVICSRRFHDVKGQVAEHRAPGVRHDLPGRRNQPPPLRRGKQHHDVDQSGQQPCEIGEKVPVPPKTQIFLTGEGDQGRERAFLVAGRPEPVRGSALSS